MASNELSLFSLLGLAAGAAMLIFGLFKRHRVSSVTSAPLRSAGGLAGALVSAWIFVQPFLASGQRTVQ